MHKFGLGIEYAFFIVFMLLGARSFRFGAGKLTRSGYRMANVLSTSFKAIGADSDHGAGDDKFLPLQIGLTGSIGMGKSTVSNQFRELGFPVFDADQEVHTMYDKGGAAVSAIEQAFPGVVTEGGVVDRKLLGSRVLGSPASMETLEDIVHPLVKEKREMFLQKMANEGHFLVVYDIPLLLEKPTQQRDIDYILVTSADAHIQEERVLRRKGMSKEKFDSILSKQMPDEEKRGKADFIINTDSPNLSYAKAQVAQVVEGIINKEQDRWDVWKVNYGNDRSSTTASASSHILTEKFSAVVFDLDDTLVPVMGPIAEASKILDQYMETKFVKTRAALGENYMPTLRDEMKKVAGSNHLLSHDLTSLRKIALENLVHEDEQQFIEECMDEFVAMRSHVDPHLYEDVEPCFDWLIQHGIRVGVLTNGNADLKSGERKGISSILDSTIILNAAEVGVLKPSPVAFMAICQRGNIPPEKVLYIGDSFQKDTLGARDAGMCSAYLRREGTESAKEDVDLRGHLVIDSLYPSEIEAKLKNFFS